MRFSHMRHMMKKHLLFAAAAASVFILGAGASAMAQSVAPTAPAALQPASLSGGQREAAIAAANAGLNSFQRLQGRFTQIGPDGSRVGGSFAIQRPGKLRFEYDGPQSMIIVSDGRVVHMRDRALRQTERQPLDATPLALILAENVDLERSARVTRVERTSGALLVSARPRSGVADGEITLRFDPQGRNLLAWEIIDAAGGRTRIILQDVTQPASLDRGLFRLPDIIEDRRGGRPG